MEVMTQDIFGEFVTLHKPATYFMLLLLKIYSSEDSSFKFTVTVGV